MVRHLDGRQRGSGAVSLCAHRIGGAVGRPARALPPPFHRRGSTVGRALLIECLDADIAVRFRAAVHVLDFGLPTSRDPIWAIIAGMTSTPAPAFDRAPRAGTLRQIAAGLGCLAALHAGSVSAEPQGYTLDPTHSFVAFELLHFGTSTIRGRFGPIQGRVLIDAAARSGHLGIEIDTASASTGVSLLDARVRGSEMLDAAQFPKAYYVAKGFSFDAQGGVTSVRGEFTLRGISRLLELTAQRYRCYPSPLFGREVCGGDFSGEINRSEFGISHSVPFVSDRVRLLVQVEGVRDP
jgi:polyisoprenoid-binding protein YceI